MVSEEEIKDGDEVMVDGKYWGRVVCNDPKEAMITVEFPGEPMQDFERSRVKLKQP